MSYKSMQIISKRVDHAAEHESDNANRRPYFITAFTS